jgi:hypothetical protein
MKLRLSLVGVAFAVAFVLLALVIDSQHYEGSWGGMFIFVLGFPLSIVGLLFGGGAGSAGFALLVGCGAIQWYLLGMLVQSVVERSRRRRSSAIGSTDARSSTEP